MIKKSDVIPVIFARGGSKGIRNKNIKLFHGLPLIAHTINFALIKMKFKNVYVSTNDINIKKISLKYGAIVIDRPKKLATSKSPEILSWKHASNYLLKEKIDFSFILSLPTTSPLRTMTTIRKIFTHKKNNFDMIVSITNSSKSPYFNMLKKNIHGNLKTVFNNFSFDRRQDVPLTLSLNPCFYLIKKNYIKNMTGLFDGKVIGIDTPKLESVDIDDMIDFKIAEYLYGKYK